MSIFEYLIIKSLKTLKINDLENNKSKLKFIHENGNNICLWKYIKKKIILIIPYMSPQKNVSKPNFTHKSTLELICSQVFFKISYVSVKEAIL